MQRPFDITDSDDWTRITKADLPIELPEARWTRGKWSVGHQNAAALSALVRWTQPRVIVETGTFEGHATTTMAAAAHENVNGAKVFTVDYNGDPTLTDIPTAD